VAWQGQIFIKPKNIYNIDSMQEKIPKIKRTLSNYLNEENGRITKHSVLSLGAILASAALASTKLKDVAADTLHNHTHLSYVPHSSHSSHASY
tara:strand:- start:448 stop:726 length:279 start_codon:yes stop_codon:yes gene_type:complete